jgi:Galactose oxidase, central domain
LITGGWYQTAYGVRVELDSAELFDPETGTFTRTGDMTSPRVFHTATLLPDGRVLIAGGGFGHYLATAELYDPLTGTFIATGNMVTARSGPTLTLLDSGKVLIAGGAAGITSYGTAVAVPELYDPRTGTFTPTGDYAARGNGSEYGVTGLATAKAVSLPNGKVLIAAEPTAELYHPDANTFSLTGEMTTNPFGGKPEYIAGRTATLLTNGKVLVTGGAQEDLGYFGEAELYDPPTGKFAEAGNMTRRRAYHTATLLGDGTVLIAGSAVGPGASGSAELYNPATGRFVITADMISPRFVHTATLLVDGRVLMAGGYTAYPSSPNSASAELYVPSVLSPTPVANTFRFDRSVVAPGSFYAVNVAGSNLSPQTFFDVRFISPGTSESAVVLNWQSGLAASHGVPAGTASGDWTINGVRAHEIETDHTGNFFPVSATITVSPLPL